MTPEEYVGTVWCSKTDPEFFIQIVGFRSKMTTSGFYTTIFKVWFEPDLLEGSEHADLNIDMLEKYWVQATKAQKLLYWRKNGAN